MNAPLAITFRAGVTALSSTVQSWWTSTSLVASKAVFGNFGIGAQATATHTSVDHLHRRSPRHTSSDYRDGAGNRNLQPLRHSIGARGTYYDGKHAPDNSLLQGKLSEVRIERISTYSEAKGEYHTVSFVVAFRAAQQYRSLLHVIGRLGLVSFRNTGARAVTTSRSLGATTVSPFIGASVFAQFPELRLS